ncbi:MAG: ammonium transporter, Amt family, partial [Micromonosporaceae bacterium]|nr:ammonium transporter, Amt family [Micromonosporaceae bacterium]
GLFYGGGPQQLGKQAVAVVAVGVFSFVMAYLIGFVIEKTIGFRITAEAEVDGIDNAEHAESAYDFGPSTSSGGAFALAGVGAPKSGSDGVPSEQVSEQVAG